MFSMYITRQNIIRCTSNSIAVVARGKKRWCSLVGQGILRTIGSFEFYPIIVLTYTLKNLYMLIK